MAQIWGEGAFPTFQTERFYNLVLQVAESALFLECIISWTDEGLDCLCCVLGVAMKLPNLQCLPAMHKNMSGSFFTLVGQSLLVSLFPGVDFKV